MLMFWIWLATDAEASLRFDSLILKPEAILKAFLLQDLWTCQILPTSRSYTYFHVSNGHISTPNQWDCWHHCKPSKPWYNFCRSKYIHSATCNCRFRPPIDYEHIIFCPTCSGLIPWDWRLCSWIWSEDIAASLFIKLVIAGSNAIHV